MRQNPTELVYAVNLEKMKEADVPLKMLDAGFFISDNLDSETEFAQEAAARLSDGRVNKMENTTAVLICLEGTYGLKVNNQEALLHGGEAIFIYSGALTQGGAKSNDCKFILMMSSNKFYEPPLNAAESLFLLKQIAKDPVCHITPQDLRQVLTLYKVMRVTMLNKTDQSFVDKSVIGLLQAIYFQIFLAYRVEAQPEETRPLSAHHKDLYRRFVDAVAIHFIEERNIKYYADLLCVTPKYLSQIVFEACGFHAGDIIDHHVLAEAKVLLRSKKYTIAQVSDRLNFTCQSYFGRYFKRSTGYTPVQYQNLKSV